MNRKNGKWGAGRTADQEHREHRGEENCHGAAARLAAARGDHASYVDEIGQ